MQKSDPRSKSNKKCRIDVKNSFAKIPFWIQIIIKVIAITHYKTICILILYNILYLI